MPNLARPGASAPSDIAKESTIATGGASALPRIRQRRFKVFMHSPGLDACVTPDC